MSTSFAAKNKSIDDFDVNVSGSLALGFLMKEADCHDKELEKRYRERYNYTEDDMTYSFNPNSDTDFCIDAANKLKTLNAHDLFHGDRMVYRNCFADEESMVIFLQEWIEFLENCGGYERF